HPAARLAQARRTKRDEDLDEGDRFRTYSRDEVLRRKDFEDFTWDELQEARALMERTRWRLGERQTRRRRPARRGVGCALRSPSRGGSPTGGGAWAPAGPTRRGNPRPLVILCDISG